MDKLADKFKHLGSSENRARSDAAAPHHPSHFEEAKIKALHLKHKIGKFGNLINPNHRHDEAHEKATDQQRSAIAASHRYQSFAPVREGNKVKWYIDGRDYFWAVSVALERARETIYIEDWWLSPELFLRRPPYYNLEWRLDRVLKRRAEAGVKIYVIVYKEIEQALTCNSAHTKRALHSLCPEGSPGHGNIKVLRHPDHNVFENAGDMTFYWAHHEKFIIIDHKIAFIGGLDACFGRWDMHQHPLADVHPADIRDDIFPGQDFNNSRIMDFQSVDDWKKNELSKAEYGRMPWHDVSVGLIGDCVYDIAEHFVLRWNQVKRDKYKRDTSVDWLILEGRDSEDDEDLIGVQRPTHPAGDYVKHPLSPLSTKPRGIQGTVRAQIVRSSGDWSSGILVEHSIQNAYVEIIRKAEHYVYIENQFFITATGDQQSPIHNTIGRAIVDACVRASKEKRKFRIIVVMPAIPGFAGDLRQDAAAGTRTIMDYQYRSILRGEHSIMEEIAAQGVNPRDHLFFFNLRAYDRLNRTRTLIEQEKNSGVKYQDIQRAEAEDIMGEGLHPAADEDDDDKKHNREKRHIMAMKRKNKQQSAESATDEDTKSEFIGRKQKFEAQREEDAGQEASVDSIAEDAMLNGGKVSEEPWDGDPDVERENFVQEELYVHSKLLIADDRIAICGSANINDRSQLGSHDSELAIVMEDTDLMPSIMDDKPYPVGRLPATLRRMLWREHLGLLPAQNPAPSPDHPNAQPPDLSPNDPLESDEFENELVKDPLSDRLWQTWTTQASTNTETYRYLFRADPDGHIHTFEDFDNFRPRGKIKLGHLHDPYIPVQDLKQKLDAVKGHLVWMPLDFLKDEQLAVPGLALNQFTESIYT
ncbi:hypothetical protein VTO42DRAFT_99 [Malbranchea cinnamomea]